MIQRHLLRACFFCWRIQLDEPRWELLLNEKWRASLHLTVWCTKPYPSINAFLETRPDHLKTGLFGEYPRLAYAKPPRDHRRTRRTYSSNEGTAYILMMRLHHSC